VSTNPHQLLADSSGSRWLCTSKLFPIHASLHKRSVFNSPVQRRDGKTPALHRSTPHWFYENHISSLVSMRPYPRLSAKLHGAKAPLIRDVSELELLIPADALSQHLRKPLPARKTIGSKKERKNKRSVLTSHSWHGSISH